MDYEIEAWADIKGYEGLYEISNCGRVRSLKNNILLKPHKDTKGYYQAFIYKDGKRKCYLIHRLVAQAFIPNPLNLKEINHKDENPLNNNADNLEWCNRKYNVNYGTRAEKTCRRVAQYACDGQLIYVWDSITKASKNMKTAVTNIANCCKKKQETAGGYIWRYVDDKI